MKLRKKCDKCGKVSWFVRDKYSGKPFGWGFEGMGDGSTQEVCPDCCEALFKKAMGVS